MSVNSGAADPSSSAGAGHLVPKRVGVLYPGFSGEEDYVLLEEVFGGQARFSVVHTYVGVDAHREDALRDVGSLDRLVHACHEWGSDLPDSVMWACTSGSFIFGLAGAVAQAQGLAEATGRPASSTSLAFVAALERLDASQVSVVATYPGDITAKFVEFLSDANIRAVASESLEILTGAEVGRLELERIRDVIRSARHGGSDAVVMPDTALRAIDIVNELEVLVGRPVLTANQVTAWYGLNLAGSCVTSGRLGALFASSTRRSQA